MTTLLPCVLTTLALGQTPLSGPEWPAYKGDAGISGFSADASLKPPFRLSWTYRLDGDASSDAGGGVIVAAGKVFVSVWNTRSLLALDARTGRFLWERHGIGGGIRTVPTFADGRLHLLIRDGGVSRPRKVTVLVLDAATGKILWRRKGVLPWTSLASDGKVVWSYQLGGSCHASPVAADGHLLVGSDDGTLYAFREK